MHLIIEETFTTIKGFYRSVLKHCQKHDTNISFLRGFRLLLVYTHTPLVNSWISVPTGEVSSAQHLQNQLWLMEIAIRNCDTKKVYNISLAFHQLDSDGWCCKKFLTVKHFLLWHWPPLLQVDLPKNRAKLLSKNPAVIHLDFY